MARQKRLVGGRPCKLTTARALRIVAAVARGRPRDEAARVAGVGVSTLYRWEALGRSGREPFAAFLVALKAAESRGFARSLCREIPVSVSPTPSQSLGRSASVTVPAVRVPHRAHSDWRALRDSSAGESMPSICYDSRLIG
jgi:hypothetical protein